VNVVYAETANALTATTVIPQDNTVPQITEGTEVLTATINVKSTTSRLRIEVEGVATCINGGIATFAIFQNSTAGAIAAWGVNCSGINFTNIAGGTLTAAIGATGNVTIRLRVGINDNSGGNGVILGARSGGSWSTSSRLRLIVTEIEPESFD
jgi:hypothetical protein